MKVPRVFLPPCVPAGNRRKYHSLRVFSIVVCAARRFDGPHVVDSQGLWMAASFSCSTVWYEAVEVAYALSQMEARHKRGYQHARRAPIVIG